MKIKGPLGALAFPPSSDGLPAGGRRGKISPTQRARLEKVEYFRALIENAMDGIGVVKEDGVFRYHSPSLTALLGYTSAELTGRNILGFVHPDDRHVLEPWFNARGERPGGVTPLQFRMQRRQGDWCVVECNVNNLLENETVGGMVVNIRDITERAMAEQEINENREQLRSLASALSTAEERERKHLATQLHDSLGQMLALANMKLGALMNGVSSPEAVGEVRDLVRDAIKMVRTLTFDLSPPVLYQVGFEAAVEWLGKRLEQEHGIRFDFHCFGTPRPIDEDVRVMLFHVVRELLFNVVKHAGARHARVFVSRGGASINVVIEDDGIGFDTEIPVKRRVDSQSFGLFSIHERIHYIGGGFSVYSEKGEGTTVSLSVPLSGARGET